MEKIQHMICILTALAAGKVIQCRRIGIGVTDPNPWLTVSELPCAWSWMIWEFRVKPDLYETWVNIYTIGKSKAYHHHSSPDRARGAVYEMGSIRPDRVAVHMREVE